MFTLHTRIFFMIFGRLLIFFIIFFSFFFSILSEILSEYQTVWFQIFLGLIWQDPFRCHLFICFDALDPSQ